MNLILRKSFDLYANFRAAKSIKGVETPFKNVDILVIRENTEGEYSGVEHVIYEGIVQSIKIITDKASRKCIKFAFETAKASKRKEVMIVHKASIQRLTDGLFLAVGREVAKEYPDISISDLNVDSACLKIVKYPHMFSDTVMVMPNLYGDIVTDLCSGIVGGLGLTGSGNIGTNISMFESVHGSAPDIAGKGIANPTALLMSFVLLLKRAGMNEYAEKVEKSVLDVISDGKVRRTLQIVKRQSLISNCYEKGCYQRSRRKSIDISVHKGSYFPYKEQLKKLMNVPSMHKFVYAAASSILVAAVH